MSEVTWRDLSLAELTILLTRSPFHFKQSDIYFARYKVAERSLQKLSEDLLEASIAMSQAYERCMVKNTPRARADYHAASQRYHRLTSRNEALGKTVDQFWSAYNNAFSQREATGRA